MITTMPFLFGIKVKKRLLQDLKKCNPNIKFTQEINKEDIAFLDLKVKFLDGKISTDLFVKFTDRQQFFYRKNLSYRKNCLVYELW